MLNKIDSYEVKVYFLGRGSFNGNYDSDELHLGWVFITDINGKFYGKIIKDTNGFFITENEIYNSKKYRREFINHSGCSVSDLTIQSQISHQKLICTVLKGGCSEYDEFVIYYFSSEKLNQKIINSIAKDWEVLLQNYINR